MKILILYRWSSCNSFNHFCNVDFYQYLNKIPNVEAKFYGVDVNRIFPKMVVCQFQPNITLKQIWEKYNFDVIIVAGRNRTFYKPYEANSWLPSDFINYNCLKILVEPDYHKYRKLSWFKDMNFNIILHRHQTNVTRAEEDFPELKHIWFPFSVDTSIFYPKNVKRKNKVSFVGNIKPDAYYFRKKALHELQKHDLIDIQGLQYEKNYIESLQKYTVYLSGSSIYSIDCAKNLEIIASGGILLTNKCYNGCKDLLKNCYITYDNDFSNLIKKTKDILQNKEKQQKIINAGLKIIKKKHTHYKRCEDLVNIIYNYSYNSKPKQLIEILNIVYTIGNLSEDAWKRFENSYNSIKQNTNYKIKISEVGIHSSKERLQSFIDDFDYYYQENNTFDASIAKNNAYKYLISSELFSFMDIDMIVPNDFVKLCIEDYIKHKKIFICQYKRLLPTDLIEYNEINKNIHLLEKKYVKDSGILVCNKETYKLLNGFDEEYKGWGGRDSDFYKRAEIMGKFFKNKNIVLFHQYHDRNFGEYKEINRNRYYYRIKQCLKNKNMITMFKGLINNKIYNPVEMLLGKNIEVCLLKETCRDWVVKNNLNYPLHLGVSDIDKAKELNLNDVILYPIPTKTKNTFINGYNLKVPSPVLGYLENLYGRDIIKEIKK